MRRSATLPKLTPQERKPVDTCARYLLNNAKYLKYDDYLKAGFPMATGVIEGACRHLIKDRMDITGARWTMRGAEAVLPLASLYISGDWDEYWQFHLQQEHKCNHLALYSSRTTSFDQASSQSSLFYYPSTSSNTCLSSTPSLTKTVAPKRYFDWSTFPFRMCWSGKFNRTVPQRTKIS